MMNKIQWFFFIFLPHYESEDSKSPSVIKSITFGFPRSTNLSKSSSLSRPNYWRVNACCSGFKVRIRFLVMAIELDVKHYDSRITIGTIALMTSISALWVAQAKSFCAIAYFKLKWWIKSAFSSKCFSCGFINLS